MIDFKNCNKINVADLRKLGFLQAESRKSGATSNDLVDELRFVERPVGKLGRDMSTGAALQYSRV